MGEGNRRLGKAARHAYTRSMNKPALDTRPERREPTSKARPDTRLEACPQGLQSGRVGAVARFAVAPMMDWTDRHCRYFHRLISARAELWTEMVTTGALIYGDVERHLRFDESEHPVVCQLGGSEPSALATSARLVRDWGYDGVNLNCGCPSDRVQSGRFGACLMAEPALVADCIKAMQDAVDIPVSVKCRIGIDDQDSEQALADFVGQIAETGCHTFTVHARKAWLQGLSPKENRDVPPLNYERVRRLKQANPELSIALNGGLVDLATCLSVLDWCDGVMLGRAAYQTPWLLSDVDADIYQDKGAQVGDRWQVAARMADYADRQRARGVPVKSITRHMMGLFNGLAGAKAWRRYLSTQAHLEGATGDVILRAADLVARTGED